MMVSFCAAYGCSNSSGSEKTKEKGISFHHFPHNDKIRMKRWLINMRRKNFHPTPNARLCSDHFEDEDFTYQPFTNRRGLTNTAIPTKFCFTGPKVIRRKKSCSYDSRIVRVDICRPVETASKADKSTQTVDSFTSCLLAEIKKLRAENTALRGHIQTALCEQEGSKDSELPYI